MEKLATDEKIFCSLDIETTGFDPLTCEVLEVGFVFFKVGSKGFKVTEEWTKVFKPVRAVPPQIFGLTGITQAELDKADAFSQAREFLQAKLGSAVIVGHNITFDTKFLEGFGIKFSGQVIDTLDLAQWLLPTHHSYNLENLMHTFGIAHKEAHRALADSQATLKLLEKLLQVFCGFPSGLKTEIKKLAKRENFVWAEFLDLDLQPLSFLNSASAKVKSANAVLPSVTTEKILEPGNFYNFALNENFISELALAKSRQKILLVAPRPQTALELLRTETVEASTFLPENLFDEKKFALLQKKKNLSLDETKFVLKLLVWQATNWQSQTLLDLNLSFFGGQFKSLVSGGVLKENKTAKVVACDAATFLYLSEQGLYKNRLAVICGLSEFETAVSSGISTKAGWSYINYLLKSFYNPELGSGQEKFSQEVDKGLLAADLFFGMVSALLKTQAEGFEYFKVTEQTEHDERWQKIHKAAENFLAKLAAVNKVLGSKEIEKFTANLQSFFTPEENRVKWLELAENRCVFCSMPLQISGLVKEALKPFAGVSFADALDKEVLPKFFLNRLGLNNFKITSLATGPKKSAKQNIGQKDLFFGIKKAFSKTETINYHSLAESFTDKGLLEILETGKPWPAAALLASPLQIKDFYEQNYQSLKQKVSLLAQTAYGGSNKIFRNFSINKNSLMVITDKLVLKSLSTPAAVEPVDKLAVKTLILYRLPFEQFTHPYQEAVSASLANAFEDYALPRALYNFHNLIKFFYTPELKDIYIVDAKLAKPYAKIFKNYWQNIPGAKLKD